jgi:hypothetical protein
VVIATARLAISRRPRLHERAADALAATIVQRLDEPVQVEDPNQLAFPL